MSNTDYVGIETVSVSDKDIFRSAKIFSEKYGNEAERIANDRSSQLLSDGDEEGAGVWSRIAQGINWLQSQDVSNIRSTH